MNRQQWKDETGIGMFEKVYLTKAQKDKANLIVLFFLTLFTCNLWVIFLALIAIFVVPPVVSFLSKGG